MWGVRAILAEATKGVLVLLEPDDSVRDALLTLLQGQGWAIEVAAEESALGKLLDGVRVTAVISEASLPASQAADILRTCSQRQVPLVFTGHDLPVQAAVDLIRQGASDYLEKPFSHKRLIDLLNQLSNRHNN